MAGSRLDVITIGRSSVDLYGQQIGGRLEDMGSFAKSVGGSPTNMAIGAARLGLKTGVITAVGDEAMGRFILEQLGREGVDTSGVKVDRERLTALVLLGVRDDKRFPLIFYRENCADMALTEDDISEDYIASARAIVVTGTHFSAANTHAAQMKAMAIARRHGAKVAIDIDYRPNLWGLAGHGAGEERYIRSDAVTEHLRPVLALCDLIVGTEEELHIAGGTTDTLAAIRAVRAIAPAATIVVKRGPMGCVVFPGAIPDDIEDGIKGPGFPVEVYNVLGAGDGFMSGYLAGWLGGLTIEETCAYANAGGAFAVSRLLCSPEYPTRPELAHFLAHGSPHALRNDAVLNHIHWATTRRPQPDRLLALAIDHRSQLEAVADELGLSRETIPPFKRLAVEAAARVAAGRPGFGMLLDGTYGRQAMFQAADHGFWIGRPVERPGSRPLDFDYGGDLGSRLIEWPVDHTVKCLCFYHPDDPEDLKRRQERELERVFDAARRVGREVLIEIIAGKHGELGPETVASILSRLYDLGIRPDWWKLEPQTDATAWARISEVIVARDPWCRGIVLLGLEAPEAELEAAFRSVAPVALVRGFAVGRTIFADAARRWLAGEIDDEAAIADMAGRFGRLVAAWERARG